jgi:hypothetical protein
MPRRERFIFKIQNFLLLPPADWSEIVSRYHEIAAGLATTRSMSFEMFGLAKLFAKRPRQPSCSTTLALHDDRAVPFKETSALHCVVSLGLAPVPSCHRPGQVILAATCRPKALTFFLRLLADSTVFCGAFAVEPRMASSAAGPISVCADQFRLAETSRELAR